MKNTIITTLTTMALGAITAQGAITYVDATTSNTTFGDGSAFAPIGTTANDGNWGTRTVFGNGGEIYTSVAAEDSPELRTTISGLAAGNYNVFAYYWVAGDGAPTGNNQWDFATGLSTGATTEYAWNGGTQITSTAGFTVAPLITEGNRRLFQIDLGPVAADGSGNINVFINDNPGNDDRTWYDGVGFEPVPEPSSTALLGLGGLAMLLRRRR